MSEFCCEAFDKEVAERQFEPDEDGETWNIGGCCGGGCWVVETMRFCPFCGAGLRGVAPVPALPTPDDGSRPIEF